MSVVRRVPSRAPKAYHRHMEIVRRREARQRAYNARERAKEAHLRSAAAHDRAASQYELLARMRVRFGDDTGAASLRARAEASRAEASEQRAKAAAEFGT